MSLKKLISLVISLVVFCTVAGAQTSIPLKKQGETYSSGGSFGGVSGMTGAASGSLMNRSRIIGTKMDTKNLPIGDTGKYDDQKLQELEDEIKERAWNSENTAWDRACALNDEAAYKKYLAMYPYGIHSGNANKRIIDLHVDEALKNAHNDLPGIELIKEDKDSPQSTITVKNNTVYPLTVLYSGSDSKSIVVSPGHTATVTLTNGKYKIAASVPQETIRPYAGTTELGGGTYQTGYWVVTY